MTAKVRDLVATASSFASSKAATMPTVVSGDLILVAVAGESPVSNDTTMTGGPGQTWQRQVTDNNGGNEHLALYKAVGLGSGDALTVSGGGLANRRCLAVSVYDWEGDLANVAHVVAKSINPGAITPAVTDCLVGIFGRSNNDLTGAPSGYSNYTEVSGTPSLATAWKTTAATTSPEDPASFAGSSSLPVSYTVAIRPYVPPAGHKGFLSYFLQS